MLGQHPVDADDPGVDLLELVLRLKPHQHVQTVGPAGLGKALQAQGVQSLLHYHGGLAEAGERHPRSRVQVEHQQVRIVQLLHTGEPRVDLH